MAKENKTQFTDKSVTAFLSKIKDKQRRTDCETLVDLLTKETGYDAHMYGTAIVGFGSYHYVYESGREGDAPLAGFASRSNGIVLYLAAEFEKREELLAKFGKHKTSKGCVYINKLEDVDQKVLVKMVKTVMNYYKKKYPSK